MNVRSGLDDKIRIATFNWKDNGGAAEDRRAELEELASLRLDALLGQEFAADADQLAEVEAALGMTGAVAGGSSGKLHTAVLLNPEVFPGFRMFEAERLGRIRPCDVTTHLKGHPNQPITFVSLHLSFDSPIDRMRETYRLVSVAEKAEAGQPVILGGDFNELPRSDGETIAPVQWEKVTSEVHRGYRAELRDGAWEPVTAVDAKLHEFGFRDAAKHIAHRDKEWAALAATAGHTRPDQGGEVRLDRLMIPKWMTDVVLAAGVRKIGRSDHRLVWIDLSKPGLAELVAV